MNAAPPPDVRGLLVIPTYNELQTLPRVLDIVLALPASLHVLVVDDNSPDGTAGAVRAHPAFGHRVFLLARAGKLGLGSAYREGFRWALERNYPAALEMDADLSHDPHDLPRLLDALDLGADAALGSRYLNGISVINWPLHRLLLSLGAGVYVRLITGLRLSDPTSGFKAMRRDVLAALDWTRIEADGYGFQIELHYFITRAGFRLVEVPIIFTERRDGQSKLSREIAFEAVTLVLRLGWLRLRDFFSGAPKADPLRTVAR